MNRSNKRLTTAEFIDRARKIHGKKYDYSKVEYINAHTKVTIICPKHNEFTQTPKHHVNDGYGCNLCGYEVGSKKQALSTKEFIRKARNIFGDYYDYTNTKYKSQRHKVEIICKKHGPFSQYPGNHIYHGKGCNECGLESASEKTRMNQEEFIKRCRDMHSDFYDYTNTIYKGAYETISISCPIHGQFNQTANNHIKGFGCAKCGAEKSLSKRRGNTKDFIKKAKELHDGRYDYSKVIYGESNREKVIIHCYEHGDFEQAPSKHLSGDGCPKCVFKHEGRIARYLMKSDIVYREYAIGNKRYDFFLPEYNLLIERDGEQHYRDVDLFSGGDKDYLNKQKKNDKLKTKLAKKEGFKIARIPYWLNKKEEEIEIENILAGKPTYPDIPDLKQAKTKPKPRRLGNKSKE